MTFACGEYVVLPYYYNVGNPEKNTVILDAAVKNDLWFTGPSTEEERRYSAAATLADPTARFWEVWKGQDFVGLFMLQHLVPQSDATFHFLMFDGRFRGRRDLILRFLRETFAEYGFQRITMLVPEFRGKYLDWVRLKLGFRYEGEGHIASMPEAEQKAIRAAIGQRPAVWLASIGSRRERTQWHDDRWWDTYTVRLLKSDLPMS